MTKTICGICGDSTEDAAGHKQMHIIRNKQTKACCDVCLENEHIQVLDNNNQCPIHGQRRI